MTTAKGTNCPCRRADCIEALLLGRLPDFAPNRPERVVSSPLEMNAMTVNVLVLDKRVFKPSVVYRGSCTREENTEDILATGEKSIGQKRREGVN